MEEIIISYAKEGSIVTFPHSAHYYMKVSDGMWKTGVVRLFDGHFIPTTELYKEGLGDMCKVVADNLDQFYREEEED